MPTLHDFPCSLSRRECSIILDEAEEDALRGTTRG